MFLQIERSDRSQSLNDLITKYLNLEQQLFVRVFRGFMKS